MINKEELKEIINDIASVSSDLDLRINDDTILSESCSFLRGKLAGENRYGNYTKNNEKVSQNPQESESKVSEKPSEKQINLIKKLKLKIPNTKNEATILIRENINKNKEKYKEY